MGEKTIDYLIKIAEAQDSNAHGSNKQCFLIDNYALLRQNFTTDKINRIIEISNELEQKGVNVARTLDYKIMGQNIQRWNSDKNVLVSEGYVLQQRAVGTPLLDRTNWDDEGKRYQIDYLKQINSISQEGLDFFNHFVRGWIEIQKAGVRIDPSKPGNFIYKAGEDITFIDLNLSNQKIDIQTTVYEQLTVILNLNSYYKCYPEIQQAVDKRLSIIMEKYKNAIIEQGIDIDVFNQVIEKKAISQMTSKLDEQAEDTPEEEFVRLEQSIAEHIKEEEIAREEAIKLRADREKKARIERENREEEKNKLEKAEERKNGGKRQDSKMYAILRDLIRTGCIPENEADICKKIFDRKTNIYADLNPQLLAKFNMQANLNGIINDLENNEIKIDMREMKVKSTGEVPDDIYEQLKILVQEYFKKQFEKMAKNTDTILSQYLVMQEKKDNGLLTEEEVVNFRLLESDLYEFSNAKELFSTL
ncbi:MAG: hypothetical protein Q4G09_02755 [Clostridia bacterium]|nr:hypothetical protein [Clostridia bacterium]